jgi:methyl-accepting chemotaxis protein
MSVASTEIDRINGHKKDDAKASELLAPSPYDLVPATAGRESGGGTFGTLVKRLRSTLGGHEEMNKANAIQTSEMVAQIFEPLKSVQDELAKMVKILEPINQVHQFADALEPIKAFKEKVASVVEPLHNLEQEFGQFADAFEPMRILRDQMREISATFAANVGQFAQILEPLGKLRRQLEEAARALEPAGALYSEFSELSRTIASPSDEFVAGGDAPKVGQAPGAGLLRIAGARLAR